MVQFSQASQLVNLRAVPTVLEERGIKAAYLTVRKWTREGVRGHRLETLRAGNSVYTSLEALEDFFDRLTRETQKSP